MYIIRGLKETFSRPRYGIYALLIALGFYLANVAIGNVRNLQTVYGLTGVSGTVKMLGIFVVSFANTMPRFMYAAMITLSVLTGILMSLLLYRYHVTTFASGASSGFLTGAGIFLGIVAPGCASCGLGIIALLGLSSSVAFLPFQGNEIALGAIGLLTFSTMMLSAQIGKGFTCRLHDTHKPERRLV